MTQELTPFILHTEENVYDAFENCTVDTEYLDVWLEDSRKAKKPLVEIIGTESGYFKFQNTIDIFEKIYPHTIKYIMYCVHLYHNERELGYDMQEVRNTIDFTKNKIEINKQKMKLTKFIKNVTKKYPTTVRNYFEPSFKEVCSYYLDYEHGVSEEQLNVYLPKMGELFNSETKILLTVRPEDFALISYEKSAYESCLNARSGAYFNTVFSYGMDSHTIAVFVLNGHNTVVGRTLLYLHPSNSVLLSTRHYGVVSNIIAKAAREYVQNRINDTQHWKMFTPNNSDTEEDFFGEHPSGFYFDFGYFSVSYNKTIHANAKSAVDFLKAEPFHPADALCMQCGDLFNDNATNGICNYCEKNTSVCHHCGATICLEDAIQLNDYGTVICESCYETEYVTCENCEQIVLKEDAITLADDSVFCEYCCDNYTHYCEYCDGNVRSEYTTYVDSVNDYVCDECLDSDTFTECTLCGKTILAEDAVEVNIDNEEQLVCSNCARNETGICANCEEAFLSSELELYKDKTYCEDCLDYVEEKNKNISG